MRRVIIILTLLLVATGIGARATEPGAFGRYHALVIGNNDYQYLSKLDTAVNDATEMADLLREKYGYSVTLLKNATRADILRAFNRLRAELTEEDNLLIYYAGHGTLDRATDTGYWLPVDAEEDSDLNWVPNEAISRHLRGMTARHVMVIADSCYSGTLVRGAQAQPKTGSERDAWLERMRGKRSRTAITSGGLEPVVDAGGEGHSVFASAFLQALRSNESVLEGSALFSQISRPIVVNADQTPAYSDIRKAGHEGGEFLFVPRGTTLAATEDAVRGGSAPSATAAPAQATASIALETTFWQTIQNSTAPQDFDAYLAKFPNGTFADLARIRLAALAKQDRPRATAGKSTEAALAAGATIKDCETCPEMVVIAPAAFAMGSADAAPEAEPAERPLHEVALTRPFALAKYETTRAEFQAFVDEQGEVRERRCTVWSEGRWQERAFGWKYPNFEQTNFHPVVCVSWRTARQFTRWLSRKTGQTYRLPSEAEWEFAARAGAATPRPWGYDADEACAEANGADASLDDDYWFQPRLLTGCRDGHRRTAPVGSFRANTFGLHDMLGNAAEWVVDCWRDSYDGAPVDGSARDDSVCGKRTIRGGGWADGPLALRAASRQALSYEIPQASVGFRVARVVDAPVAPRNQRVASTAAEPSQPPLYAPPPALLRSMRDSPPDAYVVIAHTERRVAPSNDAPKLGTLNAGRIVETTSVSSAGDWFMATLDGAPLGFIPATHLVRASEGYMAPGFAAGQSVRDCDQCPELVVVPPGRFVMGAVENGGAAPNESQRPVTIPRAFAIGKYEVTFDEWSACVRERACRDRPDHGWGRGQRPVVGLLWAHANDYARWLSRKTGKRYRLPSEAEWEYAARAGTLTLRFWGDDAASACRFANVSDRSRGADGTKAADHPCEDGFIETAPVGSFKPNAFDLYDILGNAAEWVDDCWNDTLATVSPYGAPSRTGQCGRRSLRGGAAADTLAQVHAAYRGRHLIGGFGGGETDRYAGFRVLRDLE